MSGRNEKQLPCMTADSVTSQMSTESLDLCLHNNPSNDLLPFDIRS